MSRARVWGLWGRDWGGEGQCGKCAANWSQNAEPGKSLAEKSSFSDLLTFMLCLQYQHAVLTGSMLFRRYHRLFSAGSEKVFVNGA